MRQTDGGETGQIREVRLPMAIEMATALMGRISQIATIARKAQSRTRAGSQAGSGVMGMEDTGQMTRETDEIGRDDDASHRTQLISNRASNYCLQQTQYSNLVIKPAGSSISEWNARLIPQLHDLISTRANTRQRHNAANFTDGPRSDRSVAEEQTEIHRARRREATSARGASSAG